MIPVFDRAGALERVGDDPELLAEIIRLCREQCDSRLMILLHDVRHKDLQAVKRHAHLLRGSLGNVGARAAHKAAQELEEAALAGNVEELEARAEALIEKINEFFLAVSDEF